MLDNDRLPVLPELPSKLNFQLRSTRLGAIKRSDPLAKVDDALDSYSRSNQRYKESCAEYEALPSPRTEEQVVKTFHEAVDNFRAADDRFKDVNQSVLDWGPGQHESRGDTGAVQELRDKLQTGRGVIEQGWQAIDRMSLKVGGPEVPKVNHQVWMGGVPGEQAIRNATLWAQSGYEVNLWTDKNNLLAADFKEETAKLRGAQEPARPEDDQAITRRMKVWDDADPRDQRAGLDLRLRQADPALAARAEQHAQRLQDLQREGAPLGPGSGITVRDVSELFDPTRSFPNQEGALTPDDRARANLAHQREVGERCNFAASADLLRPIILHDHPGVYCDVDVTPPIKGMPELISTWNGVAAGHLNKQLSRPDQLRTDAPDMDSLHRTLNKLRRADSNADLPDAIVPAVGIRVLGNPAYERLLGAVEEHIDTLRTGNAPDPRTSKYEALREHASKYDPDGKMMKAFDEWKGRTKSVDQAFDEMSAVHAPENLFKALATSRSTGVSSNAVLASSTPGSAGLKTYTMTAVENSEQRFQDEHRRGYMDDTHRNRDEYNRATMQSTGPTALRVALTKLEIPTSDPRVKLPHSYAGNFSTSELDHSWWPKQQDQSPRQGQSPQQREGSRSSPAEGSGQRPVQRSRRSSKEQEAAQGPTKTVSRSGSPSR